MSGLMYSPLLFLPFLLLTRGRRLTGHLGLEVSLHGYYLRVVLALSRSTCHFFNCYLSRKHEDLYREMGRMGLKEKEKKEKGGRKIFPPPPTPLYGTHNEPLLYTRSKHKPNQINKRGRTSSGCTARERGTAECVTLPPPTALVPPNHPKTANRIKRERAVSV